MTTQEFRKQYPNGDFEHFPGDKEFRYKAIAPLFERLHENKLIYHEHAIGYLIQVEDLVITPEGFEATACPLCIIYDNWRKGGCHKELRKWKFSSVWDWMLLGEGLSFHVLYANYTVFFDENRIRRVEQLITENHLEEAYNVVWEEEIKAWENLK
jgi:hypothetical protein